MESNEPLLEVDIEQLKQLHSRFGKEIADFLEVLKTLCDERNPDGLRLVFRLLTLTVQNHIETIKMRNISWFKDHVTGNC